MKPIYQVLFFLASTIAIFWVYFFYPSTSFYQYLLKTEGYKKAYNIHLSIVIIVIFICFVVYILTYKSKYNE